MGKKNAILTTENKNPIFTDAINLIKKGVVVTEPENNSDNNAEEHMDVNQPMATPCQEEILMDILKRLPVRSLLRFKCVSKYWNTLISDPYFKVEQLSHAKHDKNSHKLLTYEFCPKGISPISIPCAWVLHCCCDGLVTIEVNYVVPDKRCILLLWNPSTGESTVLPDPESRKVEYRCLGLGYDSTIGDYKILNIDDDVPSQILALKDGCWRNIDKHPLATWNLLDDTPFLPMVHEAFHWIVAIGEYDVIEDRKFSLVSFRISNEVYGEIPLPEQILCPMRIFKFGVSVLNEMLCVHSTSF
ncbi:F-box/kelch-repeat protein [Capsicum galapagoense]